VCKLFCASCWGISVKNLGGDWVIQKYGVKQTGEVVKQQTIEQWDTTEVEDHEEEGFRFVGKLRLNDTFTNETKTSRYVNIDCMNEMKGIFETGPDVYAFETLFEFDFTNGFSTGPWYGKEKGRYILKLQKTTLHLTIIPEDYDTSRTVWVYEGEKIDHSPPVPWWKQYLPFGAILFMIALNIWMKVLGNYDNNGKQD